MLASYAIVARVSPVRVLVQVQADATHSPGFMLPRRSIGARFSTRQDSTVTFSGRRPESQLPMSSIRCARARARYSQIFWQVRIFQNRQRKTAEVRVGPQTPDNMRHYAPLHHST